MRHQHVDENTQFECICGQLIYFVNSHCLKCKRLLGFDPVTLQMCTLEPTKTPKLFFASQTQRPVRQCKNVQDCGCNWLVSEHDAETLCQSCALTRTIPDLSTTQNQLRWQKVELSKRRLIAQLLALQLPIPNRKANPENGLVFDLLGKDSDHKMPLTGHAKGLITINIHEADDDYRTQVRTTMHEHYRTMLGHFRHEVGHFYWDILIRDSSWLAPFRKQFGDERLDYAKALDAHYENGAPENWQESFISSYATMHPWEDWAETWAHYLHIMAALNTATSYGIQLSQRETALLSFDASALFDASDYEAEGFLLLMQHWLELVNILNALSRSIGQLDWYPFIISAPVLAKLQFVHLVVRDAGKPPPLDSLELK